MSAKVVTPKRICSAAARRVPQRTKSSFTFLASAGKMYLRSQSSSVTSSCRPRKSVIAACVWPLMKPGSTSVPAASIVCFACTPLAKRCPKSCAEPTKTIESPFTATTPSSMMRRLASMVTTVPPLTTRSKSAAPFGAAICARAVVAAAKRIAKRNTDLRGMERISGTSPYERQFYLKPLQARSVERFGKEFAHADDFRFAVKIREDHRNVAAELPDQLAARAAGRRQGIRIRDNGDGGKAALSFRDGLENGHPLRAHRQSIRRVFHIASAEDAARRGTKSRSDPKVGKRRVGIQPRILSRCDQRIVFTHGNFPPLRNPWHAPGNSSLRDFPRNAWNDRAQQRNKLRLHALGGLQNVRVVQRLVQNARRGVRHAGNPQDANAAVPRGDHFRNGGHADKIGANRAQIPYFRRRFVARPRQGCVNAFVHADAQAVPFAYRHFAEAPVVRDRQVRKTRAEPVIVRTAQRIHALQIDLVLDRYEPALRELRLDAARRVRHDQRLYAHPREDAHRKRDLVDRVAFIQVYAPLHCGHGDFPNRAADQITAVANGRGARKMRNLGVRNFRRRREFIRKSA